MISNFIHCTMHAMCFVQTMSTYISAITSELLLSMPCHQTCNCLTGLMTGQWCRGPFLHSLNYLGGRVLISLRGSSAIHFLSMHFAPMLDTFSTDAHHHDDYFPDWSTVEFSSHHPAGISSVGCHLSMQPLWSYIEFLLNQMYGHDPSFWTKPSLLRFTHKTLNFTFYK